jgi:predicted Zn-dependent protease
MPLQLPPGTATYQPDLTPPPSNRQLLTLLAIALGTILVLLWLASLAAGWLVWFVPPSVERQLGAVVVPAFQIQSQAGATQDALNRLLDNLETQLDPPQPQRDYRVLFVPDETVNAIAIPGDRIVIYQGLLKQVESESELAMVLGHELGHFAHRDHLRGLGHALVLQVGMATLFGDVSSLAAIASSGVASLSEAQFSRGQEQAADEFGLDLLQRTYHQVAGATDFFQRMAEEGGRRFDFLATHPDPGRRVRHLQRLIEKHRYPIGKTVPLSGVLADVGREGD